MITSMEISNVKIDDNAWTSFRVGADALKAYYSGWGYHEDVSPEEFLKFALEYIESENDVVSFDDIDVDYETDEEDEFNEVIDLNNRLNG